MIVNESSAVARLNSPMNLMNKLKSISKTSRSEAMSLFIPSAASRVKETMISRVEEETEPKPIKLDNILDNSESQIKLGLAHDRALELLNNSVSMLAAKLEDVKADKLPAVISAASKTVESIRKERAESSKNNKDREVHYHFYTPEQRKITDFEIIDVA